MIRACLCMLAGVYALQLNSFTAESDLIAIILVALFVLALSRSATAAIWFPVGLVLFTWQAHAVIASRLSAEYAGDSMVGTVRIVDFPPRPDPTVTMTVERVANPRLPPRMRISWYEPAVTPRIGDVWQFELRLRRPRGNANPGVFDFEAWLFRQGIGATGYVVDGPRNRLLQWNRLSMVDRLRRHAVDRLVSTLPGVEDAAVLAAISVGARHLVSSEQWQRYALTGTSHLMAISGLHVGLVAGGAWFLGWGFGALVLRRQDHCRVAVIAAMAGAIGFAVISGLAVPARRAALMVLLLGAGTLRLRAAAPWRVLAAAAMAVIAGWPLASMSAGFKLSFAAVAVLLWSARGQHRARDTGKALRALQQLGRVQFFLLLGLLPLTVPVFGRAVLAAPVANLLVLPVFAAVTVPCTLLGLAFDGPLRVPGDTCLGIAAVSLHVIEYLLGEAMRIRGGAIDVPALHGASVLLLAVPLCWVLLPSGWPGRWLGWLGMIALLAWQPPRPAPGCVDITMLDVGQGLAVVARTRGHTLLYDTGPAFRGSGSAAELVILPYLRSQGLARIDTLVVSHADLDHAGGIQPLLDHVAVDRFLAGDGLSAGLSDAEACHAGQAWSVDGVNFTIVHPASGSGFEGNNSSCVVRISSGHHAIWITGDLEHEAEVDLLRHLHPAPASAVVIPHHGSMTSSTPALVKAFSPPIALVSAGYNNRWGLPREAIVRRWQEQGARVFNTASSGAVSMQMCSAGGIAGVSAYRQSHHRIWLE